MRSDLTTSEIVAGLARLGAQPTCTAMVHASLSSFGRVAGGAATVVEALRTATGAEGAVIMPSFRGAIRSAHYGLNECVADCPRALCTSNERGHTGIVGETIREQSDAVRSCHPTHSWVGVGREAPYLLEGHCHSPTSCGRESPFFRLLERDGLLILLGVGVNSITNIHAVEEARNVPYLSAFDPLRRHATYTTSGHRLQYQFPDLLHRALNECRLLRTTRIGAATCHAMPARDLASFLWVVTEDDPWCLVLRPAGDRYDPAEDAAAKVARMIEVWHGAPDRTAWQFLVAASQQDFVPIPFTPCDEPARACPAYRGELRGYHRCAANDLPPWEKHDDFPAGTPGVATCGTCNWPTSTLPFTSQAAEHGDGRSSS